MPDIEKKLTALAQLLEGKVVSNKVAVPVCVKGIISGFPVTVQAVQSAYPFGTSYFLETDSFAKSTHASFKLTILSKYARGWLSQITRFLFFERRGQTVDIPALDSSMVFKCNNIFLAKEFLHCPNVADDILQLAQLSKFSEMVIQSDAGLYLSQPVSFGELDLDNCQVILQTMAKLGHVLFQAF